MRILEPERSTSISFPVPIVSEAKPKL
ncbi:hypothetical protein PI27_gp023 [Listeria phage WIL-1]|nr:hypothetical protein PI27_gp023 [Listeria phage WIL-1]